MKGLLMKEWYMLKSVGRTFLLLLCVFIGIGCMDVDNALMTIYPCILAGMLTMSLIAYDERDHWNTYAGTLPYTLAQLVSVKYLISLFLSLGTIAAVVLARSAYGMATGLFRLSQTLSFALMLLPLSLLPSALLLPFLFRYGVEKGRVMYYMVMILFFAGATLLGEFAVTEQRYLLSLLTLGSVLVYAISWRLSIAFYAKRKG